jgi:hypothetical protein
MNPPLPGCIPNTACGFVVNIRSCFRGSHNIAQGSKGKPAESHVYVLGEVQAPSHRRNQ